MVMTERRRAPESGRLWKICGSPDCYQIPERFLLLVLARTHTHTFRTSSFPPPLAFFGESLAKRLAGWEEGDGSKEEAGVRGARAEPETATRPFLKGEGRWHRSPRASKQTSKPEKQSKEKKKTRFPPPLATEARQSFSPRRQPLPYLPPPLH